MNKPPYMKSNLMVYTEGYTLCLQSIVAFGGQNGFSSISSIIYNPSLGTSHSSPTQPVVLI